MDKPSIVPKGHGMELAVLAILALQLFLVVEVAVIKPSTSTIAKPTPAVTAPLKR